MRLCIRAGRDVLVFLFDGLVFVTPFVLDVLNFIASASVVLFVTPLFLVLGIYFGLVHVWERRMPTERETASFVAPMVYAGQWLYHGNDVPDPIPR